MVSSLRALAESFVDRGSVLVALDAFRGQVYAQLVPSSVMSPRLKTLLENQPELLVDAAWNPDELARLLVPVASELWLCGGGISRYPQLGLVAHLASALPTYVTVSAAEASSPVLVQPCGPETVTWTR
jgi:tRNA A37 threonylcarbamoyladenosine modification protein TsaB